MFYLNTGLTDGDDIESGFQQSDDAMRSNKSIGTGDGNGFRTKAKHFRYGTCGSHGDELLFPILVGI